MGRWPKIRGQPGLEPGPAADLSWSGAGTWNTTSTIWGTVTGGPYDAATWNSATPDAATFQGTAGTVTLGEAITAAGRIVLGADTSLGTTTVTLDGGSIERNVPGATVANAIAVNAGGGAILGRTSAIDDYVTLSGQLTGSGALTVQGLVTLNNTTNTYSGALTISNTGASYLRLSASEVLGDTATVTVAGGNS